MWKLWGRRGVAAVLGSMMLVAGSGNASAQTASAWNVTSAVKALDTDVSARPFGTAQAAATKAAVANATVAMTNAIQTVGASLLPAPRPASIATEAAWLRSAGWPLYALVDRFAVGAPLDEQAQCIAVAVYHEARGETLEGQLAVARVIMNRAASGKYPSSWCGTVKQPWQFSFVNPRTGHYPAVDEGSAAWRKALGITRLAVANAVPVLDGDVLWYHADYVAPSWGRRLSRVQKIGAHIFYRA
jgi:N-acetylmuramoyl-L-alanine amidase